MAESRLITISQAEISPNPVQAKKSYVIRVTIANKAYGLDYPYNYPYDYTPKRKGDQSMSVKTVQAVVNGQSITLTYNSTSGSVLISGIANVRIRKASVRIEKKADNRGIKMQQDRQRIRTLRNMASFQNIFRKKHYPLFRRCRRIHWMSSGIRFRLLMLLLSGRSRSCMCVIRKM